MPKINRNQKISKLKDRYYKALTEKSNIVQIINEAEIAEHVYNSNAIENSTLTLDETLKILMEVDLDRYASPREVYEAKNLAKVVEYTDKNAKKKELDSDMILFLHKMLISNIRDDIAGRYRNINERVRVGPHIAPISEEIGSRIFSMFINYHSNKENDIVKKIARFHLDFEYTHPFVDGNGRIGRVLNNYLLIREGYVPINIKFLDRQKYYKAFQGFQNKKQTDVMEELVYLALTNSYHKRLAYMENKNIVDLSEYAKRKKTSLSNIINKAKRQTIEAFLEKGKWRIGI